MTRDGQSALKTAAIRGSLWTLSGYGSSQVLRLGSHLILAWLLAPQIFGLMALVKVVRQGLEMFSDVGIRPSIIQNKRGDDPEFLNTAWTIQVIRGFALWACTCIIAWPFAALYARNDSAAWQLMYLLPVAGFGAVLHGFQSTALATLNKHLRLDRLTLLELATQLVSLGVMIGWALVHPTVWSMVAGGLASGVFRLVASHLIVPGVRVRMTWNRECAAELVKFGKWIFLSTLFTFLSLNLDKLILGNVISLADLGLYGIALTFAKVPLYVSTRLGGTVLFPVYAKYQDDVGRMMSIALRAREVVLWAGVATCLGFVIGAPVFFRTLWDERYHEAAVMVQWISLYIWTTVLLLTIDRIPLAIGNSRALFFANVWRCAGPVLAVCGYVLAGLPGFIVGLAGGPLVAQLYQLRQLPTRSAEILMQGVRFTLGGAAYAAVALMIAAWVRSRADLLSEIGSVALLAGMPAALAAYVIWKRVRGKPREVMASTKPAGMAGATSL